MSFLNMKSFDLCKFKFQNISFLFNPNIFWHVYFLVLMMETTVPTRVSTTEKDSCWTVLFRGWNPHRNFLTHIQIIMPKKEKSTRDLHYGGPHLAVYVVTACRSPHLDFIPTILTLRAEHGETLWRLSASRYPRTATVTAVFCLKILSSRVRSSSVSPEKFRRNRCGLLQVRCSSWK